MINIGDLVYAVGYQRSVGGRAFPAAGVVIGIDKHPTLWGIKNVSIWWADNGKVAVMQDIYAVSLKKNVDKLR